MAFRGVGAVDLVPADVESGLVKPKVGKEEVVGQFVLVGKDEVVEPRLARLQGHLKTSSMLVACTTVDHLLYNVSSAFWDTSLPPTRRIVPMAIFWKWPESFSAMQSFDLLR